MRFPCVALVVSGGHTALYDVQSPLEMDLIVSTLDDAAGEAFDKVAWILGLSYPGGPSISALAAGEHRFAVYDQPLGRDGVVPFRVSFGRGLLALGGGGARAEIRGGGKRVEVATTKLAPIFWGRFVRKDEAKPQ